MVNSIEQQIVDSVDILVSESIKRAKYDKTIKATIKSCVDETIGKYRVQYQDSYFFAYSTNAEVTYKKDSYVYITVPNGDMTQDKIIIGTVDKLGVDYVAIVEGEEAYDKIGQNIILNSDKFSLSSYKTNNVTLYEKNSDNNKIELLDISLLEEYIKQSDSILLGGIFQTSLDEDQIFQGDFGIKLTINFNDTMGDESSTADREDYICDVSTMLGNPYKQIAPTRQYSIFPIDGKNFNSIEKIEFFVKNFPCQSEDEKPQDIFISSIELQPMIKQSEEEINGCSISFVTLNGKAFLNKEDTEDKTIQAQVRVKGKVASSDDQKIEYYWFRENARISIKSKEYCSYGGKGWECLNSYNVIKNEDETAEEQREWISNNDTLKVSYESVRYVSEVIYKCVVVYSDNIISKEVKIKNLDSDVSDIYIESSDGRFDYYYDNGRPTLECIIKNPPKGEGELIYYWSSETYNGVCHNYDSSVDLNNNYMNAVQNIYEYDKALLNGTKFKNATAEEYEGYVQKLKEATVFYAFEKYLNNIDVNKITLFTTYKCTVYKTTEEGLIYIGTATATISNTKNPDTFTLVIENGDQEFLYDEKGISPTSKKHDKPQEIKALSFAIYDSKGNKVGTPDTRNCNWKWTIPDSSESLISEKNYSIINEEIQENESLNNINNLLIEIDNNYSYNKTNNQIRLDVEYDDKILVAYTNFFFKKQGEDGTNGSQFSAKITINDEENTSIIYPTLIYKNKIPKFDFSDKSVGENKFFTVHLFKNGTEIYSTHEDNINTFSDIVLQDEVIKLKNIEWSFLSNSYGKSSYTNKENQKDVSLFSFENGYIKYNHNDNILETCPANILKCEISYEIENGDTFTKGSVVSTMPIAVCVISDNDIQSFKLKDNTGFRYIQYNNDGSSPQYDSDTPFTFEVIKRIGGIDEDISFLSATVNPTQGLSYDCQSIGGYSQYQNEVEYFKYYDKEGTDVKDIVDENYDFSVNLKKSDIDRLDVDEDLYQEILNSEVVKIQEIKNISSSFLKAVSLDNNESQENTSSINEFKFTPYSHYDGLSVNQALYCTITGNSKSNVLAKLHIPIHFYLNKYGLPAVNSWDGNSISIDEENGNIIAPLFGAGVKNDDGTFTGMMMGKDTTKRDIGIYGYQSGLNTFGLLESGKAYFGVNQAITIDGTSSMIHGGYGTPHAPNSMTLTLTDDANGISNTSILAIEVKGALFDKSIAKDDSKDIKERYPEFNLLDKFRYIPEDYKDMGLHSLQYYLKRDREELYNTYENIIKTNGDYLSPLFAVDYDGNLIASNALVMGSIYAKTLVANEQGSIAGWEITERGIQSPDNNTVLFNGYYWKKCQEKADETKLDASFAGRVLSDFFMIDVQTNPFKDFVATQIKETSELADKINSSNEEGYNKSDSLKRYEILRNYSAMGSIVGYDGSNVTYNLGLKTVPDVKIADVATDEDSTSNTSQLFPSIILDSVQNVKISAGLKLGSDTVEPYENTPSGDIYLQAWEDINLQTIKQGESTVTYTGNTKYYGFVLIGDADAPLLNPDVVTAAEDDVSTEITSSQYTITRTQEIKLVSGASSYFDFSSTPPEQQWGICARFV